MSDSLAESLANQRSSRWRRIGQIASFFAVAWLVWFWREEWPVVGRILLTATPWLLALGLALVAAGSYITVFPFFWLVKRCVASDSSYGEVAHLFFASQLLKHLPGRLWGVGYQLARARSRGGAPRWVAANVVFMGLAAYFALTLSAAVLIAGHRPELAAAALLAAWGGYLAGPSIARRATELLSRRITPPKSVLELQSFLVVPTREWVRHALLLTLSGILQYLGWMLFGLATGLLRPWEASQLFAMYQLAWFVGWVSLLTPSGLGVREVVFLALATAFEAETVAVMAVIGRASMLVVDVLAGVLHLSQGRSSPTG